MILLRRWIKQAVRRPRRPKCREVNIARERFCFLQNRIVSFGRSAILVIIHSDRGFGSPADLHGGAYEGRSDFSRL
jgi:hypothetical protein